MRDRQMYKYGQRVAKTLDGSRPGYRGYGAAQDSGNAANSAASAAAGSGGTSGPSGDGTGDFSTPEQTRNHNKAQADRAEAIANPSVFEKVKDYVLGGGLIGMGVRGLGNVFGGPKSFEDQYGYGPDYQGQKSYDFGPEDGPGNDDGNQGIMAAYNPYLLPEEEVLPTQEEEDFIQRFRVANEFRQDKQGQLDPAILEMISKLYT